MFNNQEKSTLLLLSLMGASAAVGYVIAGLLGVLVGAAFVAIYLLVRRSLSPDLILRLQGAVPLTPWSAPALYRMTERLARRADVAVPALYLIRSDEPNALSVGGAGQGAVAVTSGLLRLLNRPETEAVLAHEIAHLRHDDVRRMELASGAALAVVTLIRVSLWLTVIWLILFGSSLARSLGHIALLASLALVVPILVGWLQAALSQTREFAADETAAKLTGQPRALASALIKLKRRQHWLLGIFMGRRTAPNPLATHPPTEERVRRLLSLPGASTRTASTQVVPAFFGRPPRRPRLFTNLPIRGPYQPGLSHR